MFQEEPACAKMCPNISFKHVGNDLLIHVIVPNEIHALLTTNFRELLVLVLALRQDGFSLLW